MSAGQITRRKLLLSLPALALTPAASRLLPRLLAQSRPAPIPVRGLRQMTLVVTDLKRSLDFYQGLFGMPIQARQGSTAVLRIGLGPQFLALSQGGAGAKPGFSHYGMAVENPNNRLLETDRIMKVLAEHGVEKSEGTGGGLSGGPLKARVAMRMPDRGGAPEGTPEIFVGDPDGLVIQLQDPSYCGGGGVLGNICQTPEPAPKKGLLALRDLSHFTMSVTDGPRAIRFYQELFGLAIQAHQAANPVLEVGIGNQFVMANGPAAPAAGRGAAGGAGAAATGAPAAPPRASINHACMNLDGFAPDKVLQALTDYGLKARGTGPVAPLVHYVSMRMPDRGGAPSGTAELYFTDPDGILMQLQDVSYCGGGGTLGEICSERPKG
jgi:catechol 2,3-dioxygenase-like lactoylglutathione lyase family enzyme